MPSRTDFVIAREAGVILSYGTGPAGTVPLTMNVFGCPKGTVNFNRTVAAVDDSLD